MNDYPWYTLVDSSENLQQGDFIFDCPIVIPPDKFEGNQEATVKKYNVIVMSQSCDLEYGKLEIVLVCPYWSLSKFGEKKSFYKGKEGKEFLRRGYQPSYHLLDKSSYEGMPDDFIVVDFRNVFGVQFNFLSDYTKRVGKRIRLLSPFREHLSQAFARFFMRVGLPSDIPEFK